MAVQADRIQRAAGDGVEALENAEHHQDQQAGAVRRALPDLIAAPGNSDRLDELGDVLALEEVLLGVQAATGAQGGNHIGGNGTFVKPFDALAGDGPQGFWRNTSPICGTLLLGRKCSAPLARRRFSLISQSWWTRGCTGQPCSAKPIAGCSNSSRPLVPWAASSVDQAETAPGMVTLCGES
jgi:hypothetical protein